MGATSTSRAARGTRPSLRTPLPAITNGARAWTTPSDPCSPRWPPWSSQLCAAGVDDAQVGCGGVVEELGGLLERERIGVVAAVGVRVGELGREPGEMGRSTGRRTGSSPSTFTSSKPSGASGGRRPGRRRWPPRTGRRPVRWSTMSTIGDSSGSSRTSSACSRSPVTAARVSGPPERRFAVPIARCAARGLNCPFPAVSRERFACPPSLQSLPTSHAPGTSSTPTASSSVASPPRSRRCSAASTSRSGRHTSTAATTSSWSTRPSSTSARASSPTSATTATPVTRAASPPSRSSTCSHATPSGSCASR